MVPPAGSVSLAQSGGRLLQCAVQRLQAHRGIGGGTVSTQAGRLFASSSISGSGALTEVLPWQLSSVSAMPSLPGAARRARASTT
ncbi:hypothetical protein [Pannonibacter phragmitetus]|uniref:hypothetical protein n=1 Tax=Pannonibacter phragmitetus TaxID=121719 RepID=UPI00036D3083|nr:hypothetical protein [Pannonibacter phragmitetus]